MSHALDRFNNNISSSVELHGRDTVDMDMEVVVRAKAGGTIAANRPVGLYYAEDGQLTALVCALDANSHSFGVSKSALSSGDIGEFVVKGKATLASGGSAGQLVTAITSAGVIASAAAGATNADINTLGVCTAAGKIFIF